MKFTLALAAGAAIAAPAIAANDIRVDINGTVFSNRARNGVLATVGSNESVTYSFELDSTNFLDSALFPTRGYVIDTTTFSVAFSGGVTIGARDPYPAGQIPYFVLRNNDPAVDGFFLGESVDGFPTAIDTDQPGLLGQFEARFNVTYGNDPLASLNIIDAAGFYDFTGLTVFGMGLNDDFIEDVVGMDFSDMTITVIPAPMTLAGPAAFGLLAFRRRRH